MNWMEQLLSVLPLSSVVSLLLPTSEFVRVSNPVVANASRQLTVI
jgi:hypothetical protein